MYIELFIEGEKKRIWQNTLSDLDFEEADFDKKEEELNLIVAKCKADAHHLLYKKDYQIYIVVQSKLNHMQIGKRQQNLFNSLIKKNETKTRRNEVH